MSYVNFSTREILVKIVYYGPGLGGKTTSLQYIYNSLPSTHRGKMISLATDEDRTIYFDFLPVYLGKLQGFSVRLQLYTVPGQVRYNQTRRLVLKGVDGVVFVADLQKHRKFSNIESMQNLEENLQYYGLDLKKLPHVIQYNKIDLPNIIDPEELNKLLNRHQVPYFRTCAITGEGVLEALTEISKWVFDDLKRRKLQTATGKTEEPVEETEEVEVEAEVEDVQDEVVEVIEETEESHEYEDLWIDENDVIIEDEEDLQLIEGSSPKEEEQTSPPPEESSTNQSEEPEPFPAVEQELLEQELADFDELHTGETGSFDFEEIEQDIESQIYGDEKSDDEMLQSLEHPLDELTEEQTVAYEMPIDTQELEEVEKDKKVESESFTEEKQEKEEKQEMEPSESLEIEPEIEEDIIPESEEEVQIQSIEAKSMFMDLLPEAYLPPQYVVDVHNLLTAYDEKDYEGFVGAFKSLIQHIEEEEGASFITLVPEQYKSMWRWAWKRVMVEGASGDELQYAQAYLLLALFGVLWYIAFPQWCTI